MFAGEYSYNVTLKATFHGLSSEVGYFTKAGSSYTFFPFTGIAVDDALTVNTGGADWGFYIRNTFNPETGGCDSPDVDCSDATGGFGGAQYQQFALFTNSLETSYLVGVEDNELTLLPNGGDSDYNDYIFSVVPTAPELTQGRMTGGGIVTYGGQSISLGLTLHCDITLSNNLEINWPGNKWHLEKPITLAECFDDPAIVQKPPVAPLDTFLGEGYGRLNGVAGSKIEFTLVDAGEPGSSDKVQLKIYAPNSATVVLDLPLTLLNKGGNIQAHYDQPHGNKP